MVASQNEADVFRGRPEVQPVTHCHIRSCAVSREIDLRGIYHDDDFCIGPSISPDNASMDSVRQRLPAGTIGHIGA